MVYQFSEMKEQNEQIERELQVIKEEYKKQKMSREQLMKLRGTMEEAKRMNRRGKNKKRAIRAAAAAAVLAAAFILLPNTSADIAHAMERIPIIGRLVNVVIFRDYTYESDRNTAHVEIPEVQVKELAPAAESAEDGVHSENTAVIQEKIEKTAEEINAEIRRITDEMIAEFEENLKKEGGYQDILVKSEILDTTEDYFTLKLICYQGAGSGMQWNHYYTIDLSTGERLQLKDLFVEGEDYITPISENIKAQMQEQMDADENVYYWLNDEIEEWNFKAITDETSFYLNEKDHVVIGFNEGDVAPMYMGTVEFEIPSEALEDIRK